MKAGSTLLALCCFGFTVLWAGIAIAQWEYMDLAGERRLVRGISFRPGDFDTAYAVVDFPDGVYRSTDIGQTWSYAGALSNASFVAINTIDKDYVYVACYTAIYLSRDGGETWQLLETPDIFTPEDAASALAVSPCHPETVYVSTSDVSGCGGFYRSPDSGATWGEVSLPAHCVRPIEIAIHPVQCGRMYTTLDWQGPLVRSLNSGNSWDSTCYTGMVEDIALNPENPDLIYWCTSNGKLNRSFDGGDTREVLGSDHGLTRWVQSVAVNPVYPEIVYACGGTVFRSTDYGDTWTEYADGISAGMIVNHITVDGETGQVLLLSARDTGTYHYGIYRRIEDFAGISPRAFPHDSRQICLAVSPSPSVGGTLISYTLPEQMSVSLNIWDVSGRLVVKPVLDQLPSGIQTVAWNGRDSNGRRVAPGVYFVELRAGTARVTTPIVLIK